MDLVIAEKPSVARDLARALGVPRRGDWFENERYAITWCIGHLVELDEPAAYDARWKPWRLDVLPMLPGEFKLVPAKHAKAQLRVVKELLRDRRFAGVINACDAGREGELIFRYVYQHARSRLPVRRLWISSLTDDAIRRGFGHLRPGRELDPLADAARSRSEADWLVGMNATRAVTVKNRGQGGDSLLSIGRVQTPTLALIVAREHEIRAFVPRPYWEVRGAFRTADGARFEARWRSAKQSRLARAELADELVARDRAHGSSADPVGPRVVDVRARTVREAPPQLFDLTSLQRTANRRFGWSASRTLELAQTLYEQHKLITYPRTDSRHLSADVAAELPALFEALVGLPDLGVFAQRLVEHPPRPNRRIVDDAKVSDHHAIIPTGTLPRRALDRDEARLFDLIVRRFLGAFYPDAEIAVTEAWIRVCAGDAAPPKFDTRDTPRSSSTRVDARDPTSTAAAGTDNDFLDPLPPPPDHYLARGRVRMVAGWQEVAGIEFDPHPASRGVARSGEAGPSDRRPRDRDDDRDDEPTGSLPPLAIGQRLDATFTADAKQTTPPSRFSEAALLAAMESAGKQIDDEALREAMKDVGLGTPATRAAIIETLLRRELISREARHLVPTDTGIGLIDALARANVSTLASPELTGNWEARLARIARGEDSRAAFMADIERYVTSVIDALRGSPSPDRGSGTVLPPPPSPQPPAPSSPSATSPARPPNSSSVSRPAPVSAPRLARATVDPIEHLDRLASDMAAMLRGPNGEVVTPTARPAPTRSGSSKRSKRARGGSERAARTSSATARAPALACPRCRAGTLIAGQRGWGCDRWREGCRFVIWFETAGRRLTETQLATLITKGKTRKATFADARGNTIEARLVLDPGSPNGVQVKRV